jgi:hypothetical protein
VNFVIPPSAGKHLFPDLLVFAHPGAKDIGDRVLPLQVFEVLGADHAAVGDDAKLLDIEAMPHVLAYRHERFDIGGIAGPHLATDRPALIVNEHSHDHLLEVRPVILAEAPFAEALSAFSLKVDRRIVDENQLKAAEQIAPGLEHVLFDEVLVVFVLKQ